MRKKIQNKIAFRFITVAIALVSSGVVAYAVSGEEKNSNKEKNTKIEYANKSNKLLAYSILSVNDSTNKNILNNSNNVLITASLSNKELDKKNNIEQMELPSNFIPVNLEGSTENSPFIKINLDSVSFGESAITKLGSNFESVAKWYGMTTSELKTLLLTDKSVHIDKKGRILHIDEETVNENSNFEKMATTTVSTQMATVGGTSPFPLSETFLLHSKPESSRVLYINFLGKGSDPAFDTDNIPNTFNTSERLLIQRVMLRVSEDYSAFDVDVTTEPPLAATGKLGTTILITPRKTNVGGYAYLNSFTNFSPINITAYCFSNNLAYNEKYIAECISHELGHTLGLTHQGQLPSNPYFYGQGSGETGWAPIMGVGYYKNLTQWSKGEYLNANNKQDAYLTMSKIGLKPRTDDHGNTISSADPLLSNNANGYNNLSGFGRIETPDDIDVFKFEGGAGEAILKAEGSILGGNLDISLELLDINEKSLAASSNLTTPTLAKTLKFNLPKDGIYFLKIKGSGRGEPLKTGYTNYGSLGEYKITGKSTLSTKVIH